MFYMRNSFAIIMMFGLLLGLSPNSAVAGCKINYSYHNGAKANVAMKKLKVLSKGGSWTRVSKDPFIVLASGGSYADIYKATFKCKSKRRYSFEVLAPNCQKAIYYPSATGWTTSTNINFGDISRHCK